MPDGLRLLGVVLCGGKSRRMGQDKASLRTPGGASFLDRAGDRLSALCESVCLSGPASRETSRTLIADPPESYGPISGILASLRFAHENGFDACVFNPVDTPVLSIENVETLIAAFRSRPHRIVCAVNDDESKQLQPLIAIYPTGSVEQIQQWIDRKHYSLVRFLGSQEIIEVPLPSAACQNINTPDDFHSLCSD